MTKVDYKMKDIKKKIFEEGIISNEFLDIVHENMKPMKVIN